MAGQQEVDTVMIISGTMGMLILALALVAFVVLYQKKRINQQVEIAQRENEYQRQLLNSTIEVREKEQKRIALELHDDIGSALTSIKMQLSKKDLSESDIEDSRERIKNLVKQVRDISHDLLPPVLNELGLNGAITSLCRRLSEQTNIIFTASIPSIKFRGLKPEEELAIYRIVQELLNNILKHAQAKEIAVTVLNSPTSYSVTIQDNGRGFVPPSRLNVENTSLGLKNIASRVQQINAALTYQLLQPIGTKTLLIKSL